MPNNLILVGGGGHCQSVIDVIEAEGTWNIVGILDVAHKVGKRVLGYEIIGTEAQVPSLIKEHFFLVTVGQIRTSEPRRRLFQLIGQAGGTFPTITSPHAYVSPHATLGEGSIIMHQALVNAGTSVGVNSIINSQALIEHGTRIGSHCHIATGAILNGDCQVGDHTFRWQSGHGVTRSDHRRAHHRRSRSSRNAIANRAGRIRRHSGAQSSFYCVIRLFLCLVLL